MTRDDVDRLLVIAPWLVVVSLTPAFITGAEGLEVALVLTASGVLFLASALVGALAFYRHVPAARPCLIGLAFGWLALAIYETTIEIRGVLAVAASAVMMFGAVRARIPPEAIRRRRTAVEPDELAHTTFRFQGDWRDDDELRAFAEQAAHLDHSDLAVLAAAWRRSEGSARDAARRSARRALEDPARREAFDGISAEIRAWSQASVGPWTWEWGAMTDIDRGDRRRAAIPALIDTAAAIIARDAIPEGARDALMGPWFATVAAEPVGAESLAAPAAPTKGAAPA